MSFPVNPSHTAEEWLNIMAAQKKNALNISSVSRGHEASAMGCLSSNHVSVGEPRSLKACVGTTVSPSS
jgi:hypothetical protein